MDLRSYLDEHNERVPDFAAKVGVSDKALYRYMAGARQPRRQIIDRIVSLTEGKVTPNDLHQTQASA